MKVAIALLNIAFLIFISYRLWKTEQSPLHKIFWPALFLKCVAGICLGLVYTYYYSVGDTFTYFYDGMNLAQVARTNVGSYLSFLWSGDETFPIASELVYKQPRAMFLSKVTSIFCLLTTDNYWISSLYFSFICFITAWLLVKKLAVFNKSVVDAAVISFLFFPSVVFWSSGIIKESLALASLFYLAFIFLKVWTKDSLKLAHWLLVLLFIWLLWNLKYYYLAIFLPVVITTLALRFILSRIAIRSAGVKAMLWMFIFIIPLVMVSILHPNFYPERFMTVVVSSYNEFRSISDPHDLIHYKSLEATPLSLLQNMPFALFSGLFRPFLTEANNVLQYFIALENLVVLTLTLSALRNTWKFIYNKHRLLLFSILVYSVLLCIFLALSTPNFGTLSRYRVGFLPFLVLLITIDNPLINNLMTLKIFRNVVR